MRKRPRSRRVKRSGRSHDRQRKQLLTKEVRELYRPGSAEDDLDAEWHAGLEQDLETTPRLGGDHADLRAVPTGDEGPADASERQGRVIAVASGLCQVESAGERIECVLPSSLARDQRAAVAVGDEVAFTAHGSGNHRVRRVLPRRTVLSRPDPHNPRRERVIAANIDVAVHVASVIEPPLRPALIDRYLIAIDRGGAGAIVCVNKIDLLSGDADRRKVLERLSVYRDLADEILPVSARTGEGLEALRAALAGKTTVFAGHSGVGKSSLLNALDPGLEAATARLAGNRSGRHTTTRSNLYQLPGDIQVIDTPGIRELGLWKLHPRQLRDYFPDLDPHAAGCRFNDCSHNHEPECAVRAAVTDGTVAGARYQTYLRILDSLSADD